MTLDSMIDDAIREKLNSINGVRAGDIIDKDDITIVIPTLNEEKAIGLVLQSLLKEKYYNILVVDGSSIDATVSVVKHHGITVLEQHGRGKTGAIRTAIDHVETPFLVIMDGDYTYDPRDIENFRPHMKYFYQIIGSRTNGRHHISRLNRIGNWMINKFFNLSFGTKLKDVCSGLYSLNTVFAKSLILETSGFDVEVEIAAQAADNASLTEIPIRYGNRIGKKKLNPWKDGLKIMFTIFKMARIYNSVTFYSLLAAFTMFPSLLLLAWVALAWFNGVWHSGLALLGVMMAILSAQSFVLSTLASHQRNVEQRILHKLRVYISEINHKRK